MDPVQNLGNSFDASIEKVFVCAGRDGYVPKYNPENQEYGCLADTPNLRERFKILVSIVMPYTFLGNEMCFFFQLGQWAPFYTQ